MTRIGRSALVALSAVVAACSNSTGPSSSQASIVGHTALAGSPFGVAASTVGTAYVLRHTANAASRFNLPDMTSVGTFGLDANPTAVAFNSTGALAFVTAQFANRVQVISAATNAIIDSISVTGNPFVVAVSHDDQTIFVSTNVDSLYQIDLGSKAVVASYAMPLVPNGLVLNPINDSLLYASTLSAGEVIEVNYLRHTLGRTFSPGGTTQGVAVSLDGTTLFVANETSQEVDAYSLSNGAPAGVASTAGGAFDVELSQDGSTLWVTSSNAGMVEGFDRQTLKRVQGISTGGAPRRIAVNPVTGLLVIPNESGWVDFIK